MVQILPQPTSINQDIGRGLSQGLQQGGNLAQQFLPLLLKQQINQQALQGLPGNGTSHGEGGITLGGGTNQGGIGGAESSEGSPFLQPSFGPQKLSAEEINRRVQNSLDPVYARQLLNDYNAGIEAQQVERMSAIRDRLGGELTPSQEAVAARLDKDPRFASITDPQLRADAIGKEVQKYTASFDEFAKGAAQRPTALFFNDYRTKLQTLKNQAKQFIDLGQRDEVVKALADGGWSNSEIAQILNPLSPKVKQQINASIGKKMTEVRDGKAYLRKFEKLDDILTKVIQPGKIDPRHPGVLAPGTSLLLVRNELAKNGIDYRDIDRAVGRLVNTGKLNLDGEQKREYQMLSQSPASSQSLVEVLFGPAG